MPARPETGRETMETVRLTEDHPDFYLFNQGTLREAWRTFGSFHHGGGNPSTRFTLWAPAARQVSVTGSFNGWEGSRHRMESLGDTGVWTLDVPEARPGDLYKYEVLGADGRTVLKADPFARQGQLRPETASVIQGSGVYSWGDRVWMERKDRDPFGEPMNIYEMHPGSWRRSPDGGFLSWRQLAESLPEYLVEMGYTHVELMPVMEHPLDGSWGYQITGFYGVTSRYGTPDDFRFLVDRLHQAGIGVILDWVPGHFCRDSHGLARFDGTSLYEYADPLRADRPQWGTLAFDLGKNQVRSFLISNALYWLEEFHADGLRVDAVASMLYLDFGKDQGQWRPNRYGGREDLEAVEFLRELNRQVFSRHPAALMMAEESTAWPLVTAPVHLGGLGFNYKWNMGWMNDVLRYTGMDPIYRRWHHELLTFSFFYAFSENFVLPLSHDEVVHGKKSLLDRMPGDYWQKFAGLRLLAGYLMTHPGKKLLFMGGELGQFSEWDENRSLDWMLLNYPAHSSLHDYYRRLNHFYLEHPQLWEADHLEEGFSWVDPHNPRESVIAFLRTDRRGNTLLAVLNFTPRVHEDYRVGVPEAGSWREVLNSDHQDFGGSGVINEGDLVAEPQPWHNRTYNIRMRVPPLGMVLLEPGRGDGES